MARDPNNPDPVSLPIVEESVRLEKRSVTSGRVRISIKNETIEELVRESLQAEQVEVERIPRNEEVATAPLVRTEGDVVIVPVLEEVLVIEKRLVLKEEIRIRRHAKCEDVAIPVQVRKQRVVVEDDHRGGQDSKLEDGD